MSEDRNQNIIRLGERTNLSLREIGKRNGGLTRERVRQILVENNVERVNRHHGIILRWDCFTCGSKIEIRRSLWEDKWLRVMPGSCRECAAKARELWCTRGHLKAENMNAFGLCRMCASEKSKCVVKVVTCIGCGKPRNISYGVLRQIKLGNGTGQWHHECWIEEFRKTGLRSKEK